jgi:short-subunit dehydrogenase
MAAAIFEGSTVLITGASRGIGAAFAQILSQWRPRLVLVARTGEDLQHTADRCVEQGATVRTVIADLRVPSTPATVLAALEADGITVDHLINNAGIGPFGRASDIPVERQLEAIQVNVCAATELALLLLPGMVDRRRGGILNVASTAAFQGVPFMSVYGGTKAFLLTWGEAIWRELRGTGVRCCTLCPGPTDTDFFEANGLRADVPPALFQNPDQVALLGLNAYIKDRSHIVSGATNMVGSLAVRLSPRRWATKVSSGYAKPRDDMDTSTT